MMEKKNYVLEMLVKRYNDLLKWAEYTDSKLLETEQVQKELKERQVEEKEEIRQVLAAINKLESK